MVDSRVAVRTLIQRAQAEDQRLTEQLQRLRSCLPAAAQLLQAMGAREVWLFGTVAWGGMHAHSDIDLAVSGLPANAWAGAVARVEDIVGIAVDLLRFEEIPAAFAKRIREEGQRIDGAR